MDQVNVLVLGSGGREHALADTIASSPRCRRVYVGPGNAGTGREHRNVDVDPFDADAVASICGLLDVGLVVIGPEDLLAAGLADALRVHGVPTIGPGAQATRIESSKSWAKHLMQEAGVPTADFAVFTDPAAAHDYVDERGGPLVVKRDGLAAGKGVIVAANTPAAHVAVDRLLAPDSEDQILIEACMVGPEASVFALVDERGAIAMLPSATDYKRLRDGDAGPNTGGMGAISPSPHLTPALEAQIMTRILRPTVDSMIARGCPFGGILYAGLMLTESGPQVVEFNARLGDPEAQVVLPRIASDFLTHVLELVDGRLGDTPIRVRSEAAAAVTLAAHGYPEAPATGTRLPAAFARTGWLRVGELPSRSRLFHAGTREGDAGAILSAGGRVASAVGVAPTPVAARSLAYQQVALSRFGGAHVRRDIGN